MHSTSPILKVAEVYAKRKKLYCCLVQATANSNSDRNSKTLSDCTPSWARAASQRLITLGISWYALTLCHGR